MKISLAPLQGITTAVYRNAFQRHFSGIDAYYTPFLATAAVRAVSRPLLRDFLPERNDPAVKLIPQLLGNNGGDFRVFASAVAELGYNEINWNIGCPYATVTDKKKGAGLLPYPDKIRAVLDEACAGTTYSVSVKMRLGMNDPLESGSVIDVLNEYPLAELIIHARTGEQGYDGKVDLKHFKDAMTHSRHAVTYNGDIFHYDDFLALQEIFPSVNSIMLGRGALSDPFLPSVIKGMFRHGEDRVDILKAFHAELYSSYSQILSGGKHLGDKMKEVWEYLSVHIDESGEFSRKIKKCKSIESYDNAVAELFASHPQWLDKPEHYRFTR